MRRRNLLRALAAAPLAAALGACRHVLPRCPNDPVWTTPESPLTIDVHAHVFNGTDLQVKEFVRRVGGRQLPGGLRRFADYFGEFLESLTWSQAPRAAQELEVLREISDGASQCPDPRFVPELDQLRRDNYRRASQELRDTAARVRAQRGIPGLSPSASFETASDAEKGLRAIEALPATYEDMLQQRLGIQGGADVSPERKSIDSVLAFFVEMFQYRYGSVFEFLRSYNRPGQNLDLMLAHLVDYDWWLAGGKPTATSLRDQVEVMASISVLTGGRVHAFVPFCPLRELQHRRRASSTFSSLELVKWAVTRRGAMGIKLYPPMGFAPLGNAAHAGIWDPADWLPPMVRESGFGAALDGVLGELYAWCVAEGVPLMAHTNRSNGPLEEFEKLAGAAGWEQALRAFPGLRINFGHFGTRGSSSSADAARFVGIMSSAAGSAGERAFADAAYFAEALDHPAELEDALLALFGSDPARARVLASRFVYGSDWKMLLLEANAGSFLADMQRIADNLARRLGHLGDFSGLKRDFLGGNSAAYLGLATGSKTRQRIQDFYDKNNVSSTVSWQRKVDNGT